MLVSTLEKEVFECIRNQALVILKNTDGSLAEDNSASEHMESAIRTLYEQFVLGEISPDDYKTAKTELAAASNRAKPAHNNDLRKIAGDALKAKKLTQPLVEGLIEKVNIYPGGRVEIIGKETRESTAAVNI